MTNKMILAEEQICSLKKETQKELLNVLYGIEDDLNYECREVSKTIDFLQEINYNNKMYFDDRNNCLIYTDKEMDENKSTLIVEDEEFTFTDHETGEKFVMYYGTENDGTGNMLWITIKDENGVSAQLAMGYIESGDIIDLDNNVLCLFVNSNEYCEAYNKKEEK